MNTEQREKKHAIRDTNCSEIEKENITCGWSGKPQKRDDI